MLYYLSADGTQNELQEQTWKTLTVNVIKAQMLFAM